MEYYVGPGLPKTTHVINQNEFNLVLLLPFSLYLSGTYC